MVVLAIIFIIVFLPEIVSGIVVGGLALLQVIGESSTYLNNHPIVAHDTNQCLKLCQL